MEDLKKRIGATYMREHLGQTEMVELKEVRRSRVKVRDMATGNDFLMPIAKLLKHYREV